MKVIFKLFFALMLVSALQAQTLMPIGPHTTAFTGMVRGYHFTSPVAFNICALYIPPDAPGAAGQTQHIRVVRFATAAPPAFPGTTNAFVQLFSITNAAPNATVPCNIPVNAGDIIGIYGARAGNCINTYDGVAFNTTILGQPTTCRRSGMQACISAGQPMANIWSEVNFSIGRIFMYYNCCPTPTITTAASATNICAGASVTIFGGGANTYTWMPGNINTQNITVTPTVSTTYTLSGDVNNCIGTNTVAVNVNDFPTYTVSPITSTICQNGTATASIEIGWPITGTPCSTTGLGPVCPNPPVLQVGNQTGQNTAFQHPAIYANTTRNSRHQMLIRANELTAAGIGPGYLTSLAFNVTALSGAVNYPNFTIRVKCTAATFAPSPFDNVNLNQVYTVPNHNVTLGWNTHTFQTPFYWDGVSNLLVDVCYSMLPNTSSNCSTAWETLAYIGCRYYSNSVNMACMTNFFPVGTTNRPLMRFGNCAIANTNAYSYTWTPGPGISAPNATLTNISPAPITGSAATNIYSVIVTPTAGYCPITQTLAVTIVNPLTPTLTPINPVCNTFGTVQLQASPGGGTWTTSSAVSANGVLTPSLASIGTNTVLYSVAAGSCIVSNTMSFDVSQFNTAAINFTVGPQCHSFPPINLMGLVQSTLNGNWSGTAVTSNTFNPTGLQTGTYVLTYSTTSSPNATLCPDSRTLAIQVLNPITPTLSANHAYCNNSLPIQVSVNPANSGTWIPTGYLDFQGIFTPSNAAIGPNMVQYVVGTPTCNVTSTLNINIEQFISAALTNTVPDKCSTDPVLSLSALVGNQSGTWAGPGVNGAFFDPGTSGVGALTLTYSTHSMPTPSLCPDNSVLTINVFSLAPAQITNYGPVCNTQAPFKLNVTPLGGHFYSLGSQVVDFTGLFQPMFANIGANVVSYSIASGPCIAVTNVTVNVEKFVPAQYSKYPGPFCKNDPQINLFNYVQYYGGTFTGPGVVNGSIFDPSQANVGDNNEIIYSTHSIPTASLCPDTAMVRIKINDYPKVTINSSIEKGCEPLEVLFNTPDVNSGLGTWYFGDGTPPVSGLNVVHTFSNSGSYNVLFTYRDEIGCSTSATLPGTIIVYQNPSAYFVYGPDKDLSLTNPAASFTNQSISLGHNTYSWKIGDLYTLSEVNPYVVFPAAGDYLVTLTATSFEGCKSAYSQLITVKHDFGVYIPNVFTPNYDGLNDYFRPEFTTYGIDKDLYEFEIFDRWGLPVFQTREFGLGWDGTKFNRGDEMLKEGVFVYKLKYKDSEGKIYHRTGHVTLMK
jgi:gliding motility-associated-like protein